MKGGITVTGAIWIAVGATFLCVFVVFISLNMKKKK
jgi:hypothetical protein